MSRTDKWMRRAAVLALLIGMSLAFFQGLNVYASAENEAVAIASETEDAGQYSYLEDASLPAAQFPMGTIPWWCYLIAAGSIVIGCATYGFIRYQEQSEKIS